MTINERSTVVGVFTDRNQAERAIAELQRAGFRNEQIGFIVPNANPSRDAAATDQKTVDAGTGAVTGAVGGTVLGGLIGAAVALLVPGVGPVLAGGVLAATLGGAAVGAAAGGILGALTGLGLPETEARYYEGEFQSGRILVTVQPQGRYQEATDILRRNGAYDASTQASPTTRVGSPTSQIYATTSPTNVAATGYPPYEPNARHWVDEVPAFRADWEQRYGSTEARWEDYEPAYRYGWEKATNPALRGRSWLEVESLLRRDWETRYRDKPWNRVADTVRYAWDRLTGSSTGQGNYDPRYRNP